MRTNRRARTAATPAPVPWWLVPNVLALDAPLVAVVWQRFLTGRFGIAVPVAASVALAAVVWAVYLADRTLDARRGALDADRHQLAARRPHAFLVAFAVAIGTATVAALRLPSAYSRAGLVVGGGVVGYLVLVHLAGGRKRLSGAKELLVGIGFAAGVGIPLAVGDPPVADWLPAVVAFAGLCWLNCRLIDHWESPGPPQSLRLDLALGVGLVAGSFALPSAVGLAVILAVGGLLLVHVCCRHRPRMARVLVDLALLTPLFTWAVP